MKYVVLLIFLSVLPAQYTTIAMLMCKLSDIKYVVSSTLFHQGQFCGIVSYWSCNFRFLYFSVPQSSNKKHWFLL